MRKDQLERLKDLTETLADRFLVDADPGEWPGGSKVPADMTKEERGDAVWCRKMAMATGGVLRYALDLLAKNHADDGSGGTPESAAEDSDLDRQIRDAEQRAAAAVARAKANARG